MLLRHRSPLSAIDTAPMQGIPHEGCLGVLGLPRTTPPPPMLGRVAATVKVAGRWVVSQFQYVNLS